MTRWPNPPCRRSPMATGTWRPGCFNRIWSEGPRWPDLPEATRAAMSRAIIVVPSETDFIYNDSEQLLSAVG